jgi:hypothetical protein
MASACLCEPTRGGNKINTGYQIDAGGFSFREAVLIGANFRLEVMGNMAINNKLKYFRKIFQ